MFVVVGEVEGFWKARFDQGRFHSKDGKAEASMATDTAKQLTAQLSPNVATTSGTISWPMSLIRTLTMQNRCESWRLGATTPACHHQPPAFRPYMYAGTRFTRHAASHHESFLHCCVVLATASFKQAAS
jgi:hypothetical protein